MSPVHAGGSAHTPAPTAMAHRVHAALPDAEKAEKAVPGIVTVIGANGFIGRHLVAHLRARGHPCWSPERGSPELFTRSLGTVLYCAGLTADFRSQPFATVEAHVGLLSRVLQRAQFDRLVYLSSTRVYQDADRDTNAQGTQSAEATDAAGAAGAAQESQVLRVAPLQPEQLYNLSKLLGESLVLSCAPSNCVVRLSNVFGPGMSEQNFLGALLCQAKQSRELTLASGLTSEKDYIWIDDAVAALAALATERGADGALLQGIVNVGSGSNLSHADVLACFAALGVPARVPSDAPTQKFPPILVGKLTHHVSAGLAAAKRANAVTGSELALHRMRHWLAQELTQTQAQTQVQTRAQTAAQTAARTKFETQVTTLAPPQVETQTAPCTIQGSETIPAPSKPHRSPA